MLSKYQNHYQQKRLHPDFHLFDNHYLTEGMPAVKFRKTTKQKEVYIFSCDQNYRIPANTARQERNQEKGLIFHLSSVCRNSARL